MEERCVGRNRWKPLPEAEAEGRKEVSRLFDPLSLNHPWIPVSTESLIPLILPLSAADAFAMALATQSRQTPRSVSLLHFKRHNVAQNMCTACFLSMFCF